jgi:hypothetical protein
MDTEDYLMARNGLMAKNLIAFDGLLFQVLSLPQRPVVQAPQPLKSEDEMAQRDPATIHQIIRKSLGVNREGS